MCFSESVSWLTLAASWSGCVALARSGRRELQVLAALLVTVGAMQLWEALLWREPRCTPHNARLSQLGALNNHLEPVVYWLAAKWLLQPRSPQAEHAATLIAIAYCAVFGYLTVKFMSRPTEQQCTVNDGNGLVWQWNDHGSLTAAYALFVASLVATSYAYMPPGIDAVVVVTMLATYAISFALYRKTKMVGSMWCYFAAFLPWFALTL